jgi:hypothetical protein
MVLLAPKAEMIYALAEFWPRLHYDQLLAGGILAAGWLLYTDQYCGWR